MHQLHAPTTTEHESALPPQHFRVFEGSATVFIEREHNRLVWMVQPSAESEAHRSIVLRKGDFLRVIDSTGRRLFEGDIDPVYSLINPLHTYNDVSGHSVPPLGFEISWHQRGWEPSAWAGLFTTGTNVARIARRTDLP